MGFTQDQAQYTCESLGGDDFELNDNNLIIAFSDNGQVGFVVFTDESDTVKESPDEFLTEEATKEHFEKVEKQKKIAIWSCVAAGASYVGMAVEAGTGFVTFGAAWAAEPLTAAAAVASSLECGLETGKVVNNTDIKFGNSGYGFTPDNNELLEDNIFFRIIDGVATAVIIIAAGVGIYKGLKTYFSLRAAMTNEKSLLKLGKLKSLFKRGFQPAVRQRFVMNYFGMAKYKTFEAFEEALKEGKFARNLEKEIEEILENCIKNKPGSGGSIFLKRFSKLKFVEVFKGLLELKLEVYKHSEWINERINRISFSISEDDYLENGAPNPIPNNPDGGTGNSESGQWVPDPQGGGSWQNSTPDTIGPGPNF